jgi:hypothetical protein
LKTILKEIDPFAFEEALRMNPNQKKQFAVKQEESDRTNFDKKWERINNRLKQSDHNYAEPEYPFKQSSLIRDFNELYQKIYDKEKYVNL